MLQADPTIEPRIKELNEQMKGLSDSLREVQRMQGSL